jgi:hypothetical protein
MIALGWHVIMTRGVGHQGRWHSGGRLASRSRTTHSRSSRACCACAPADPPSCRARWLRLQRRTRLRRWECCLRSPHRRQRLCSRAACSALTCSARSQRGACAWSWSRARRFPRFCARYTPRCYRRIRHSPWSLSVSRSSPSSLRSQPATLPRACPRRSPPRRPSRLTASGLQASAAHAPVSLSLPLRALLALPLLLDAAAAKLKWALLARRAPGPPQ